MRRCVSLSGADMDPTIIAGGLKLLGGLFGKKKTMSPQQSIMSTAAGARQAAKAYGFNALTLLAGSNATAGAGMDMGAPPLASLAVLGDIIEENYGDEAKARKEHNRLQNELLTLEVDRARSLNAVAPEASVAGGGALTGGRDNARVGSFARSNVFGAPGYADTKWLTPGREDKVKPQEYGSGVLHYDNALTGPVTLLGDDGEPFMEYLQVPLVGGFQVMNNWAERIAREHVVPWIKGDPDWKPEESYLEKYPYGRDAYGRPLPKPN